MRHGSDTLRRSLLARSETLSTGCHDTCVACSLQTFKYSSVLYFNGQESLRVGSGSKGEVGAKKV